MGMTVNDLLARMCKEGLAVHFKQLFRNISGGTDENHDRPPVNTLTDLQSKNMGLELPLTA
jgi:hypothetical protein